MTVIERYAIPGVVRLRLGLLAACLFVVATNGFVIAGVLPAIGHDLGVSEPAVGSSITAYAVVVAVVAPAASVLLAAVPRRVVLTAGVLLVAVGTAVAAASGGFGLFTAGRVLAAVGGAALVPAATAAAPSLLPVAERGRALAIAGLGFTLAPALGAPLGTALASAAGWRVTLGGLAGIALVLAVAVGLLVREVPEPPRLPLADRFRPLLDRRVVPALVASALAVASFNIVYIYAAAVVRPATGGNGTVLAALLLVFGLAGIAGTALSGRFTDRRGSRAVAAAALGAEAVALLLLAVSARALPADVALFALWGVAAFAITVPLQARLVSIDPGAAGILLSWFSTAMYLGIGLAPVVGGAALAVGSPLVPVAGAAVALVALAVFSLGSRAGSVPR